MFQEENGSLLREDTSLVYGIVVQERVGKGWGVRVIQSHNANSVLFTDMAR